MQKAPPFVFSNYHIGLCRGHSVGCVAADAAAFHNSQVRNAIFEVQVPEAWIGKSVGELNVRRKFGITILGIKRAGKTDVSVTPDTILSDDTTILALDEYKALQKCFRI